MLKDNTLIGVFVDLYRCGALFTDKQIELVHEFRRSRYRHRERAVVGRCNALTISESLSSKRRSPLKCALRHQQFSAGRAGARFRPCSRKRGPDFMEQTFEFPFRYSDGAWCAVDAMYNACRRFKLSSRQHGTANGPSARIDLVA